ncbi:hypothetical protein [Paracoccus salsus]|uniref:hypothetical protein n=1 Tax=Paracoccus salsus TaxID=2911061 RepID=UPI001F1FEE28|nr:hypothetical protein [Paracoccus salsus]MCF3973706.1 hypothetical protein [Paracoccus salsus]
MFTRHCFRSLFKRGRFFESRWQNRLSTNLSVIAYVARIWRPWAAVRIVAALALAIGFTGYELLSDTPAGWGWLLAAAGAAWSMTGIVWQFLNLHRTHVFGSAASGRHDLSRDFFDHGSPDPVDGRLVLSEIEGGVSEIHDNGGDVIWGVVEGKRGNRNGYVFDNDVARALAAGGIAILPSPDGDQRTERDLMRRMSGLVRDFQAEGLGIRRRNSIRGGRSFFDAPKIRLSALRWDQKTGLSARIGRTSYFTSCLTNDLAAQQIKHGDRVIADRSEDMYPVSRPAGPGAALLLKRLADCPTMSNHVGSVVLALSREGYPVLSTQGGAAEVNKGKAVLSGSGSIDWADMDHSGARRDGRLDRAILYGMARELLEETRLIPQDSLRECDYALIRQQAAALRLAGLYRDLRRGGLPIFVGFGRIDQRMDRILEARPLHPDNCPFSSPAETRLLTDLPQAVISDAGQMIAYLERHLTDTARVQRDPSDQILILLQLLERSQVLRDHFDRAITAAPASADPAPGPARSLSRR